MMLTQEWPAKDYAIGSYIQATVADDYLKYLTIKPTDSVLDIGCGNGAFSRKILDKVPQGSFLGLDASENMLDLAKEEMASYTNASLQKGDVLTMKFNQQFDYVVSFWCLQWCALNIDMAFQNIYDALKANGKILAILPAGDDSFINNYYALKESGTFSCLDNFKSPVNYMNLDHLPEKIASIPFKEMKIEKLEHNLLLPSLDVFRKFVNGLAFFHGQVSADKIGILNEALVDLFEQRCNEQHQGEYWFDLSIYVFRAEK